MSLPRHILCLEEHLDGVPGSVSGFGADLVRAIKCGDWTLALRLAESIFGGARVDEERAFVLFCATAVCEMQSNMSARSDWMRKWIEVGASESNPYCRFVRLYQNGLSAFFEGYLTDAESRLIAALTAAKQAGFPNGEMRALFHLALVARDRRDSKTAWTYLESALAPALNMGAARYETRIREQMSLLGGQTEAASGETLGGYILEIENALSRGDLEAARRSLAKAEILRRRLRIGRRVVSLYTYLPLIFQARGKLGLVDLSLRWIDDPLLLIKVLEWKSRIAVLATGERETLMGLYALHGFNCAVRVNPVATSESEVHGKKLAEIQDEQLKSLFSAFLQAEAYTLSKEELCRRVWQLSYDPFLHDGRIYKLIHKARNLFPGKKVFANTYGGYRLNVSNPSAF